MIPEEIITIIHALDSKTRLAIMGYLARHGKTPMEKLLEDLKIRREDLEKHMKILAAAGLTERLLTLDYTVEPPLQKTHYRLSELGIHVWKTLPKLYLPQHILKEVLKEMNEDG